MVIKYYFPVDLVEKIDLYIIGKNLANEPIVYIHPPPANPHPPEDRLRYLIYLLEEGVKRMDEDRTGVEKLMWIIDFSQFGKRAKDPASKKLARGVLGNLQNHYPERLSHCFVIDTPWWANFLWWIVKPFINSTTSKKIHFLKGKRQELLKFVDPSQLDEKFGGLLRIDEKMIKLWDSNN